MVTIKQTKPVYAHGVKFWRDKHCVIKREIVHPETLLKLFVYLHEDSLIEIENELVKEGLL